MTREEELSPIRWSDDHLALLDQTLLPREERWLECREPETVAAAIRRLSVRGAPAIGVSAAYGLVLGLRRGADGNAAAAETLEELGERFEATAALLAATRPTAVNLAWAIDRGREVFGRAVAERRAAADPVPAVVEDLLAWADRLHAADIEANRRIGDHGATLFAEGDRVLTHCNAGALATAGYGTALGVVRSAWRTGRLGMVWVDETRPLLQGARLTAWELGRDGIPHRLVTDSSAGALMARGLVERIVVGADRIAANGDTANKIGTYPLAVLAQRHGVPFYVAAPTSTVDPDSPDGDAIPIEERAAGEVTDVFGTPLAPEGTEAFNPAFDITPAELITAIVTDQGVVEPPFGPGLAAALERATDVG